VYLLSSNSLRLRALLCASQFWQRRAVATIAKWMPAHWTFADADPESLELFGP
jgi:hypothetical protein